MSLIGLDIGTTGCKAIVFREDGAILGAASREYGVLTPHPGWAEQDAELVWTLAWSALCQAVRAAGEPPVALALSCQGEAVAPVDRYNRPLCPMLLGMDTRTGAQNAWLAETLGSEWLYERTGMPVHTINTLPKLLWLREHEPALFGQATRFLLYEDLLLARLIGEPVISHCLASRTQLYDLRAGGWDEEILARCGLDSARLAPLAPLGVQPVGQLRTELAAELGVSTPILVTAGGHDQACAALGCGALTPGAAMVSTGTAEVVEVALAEPTTTPALGAGGISIYRHVAPGLFLAMTLNQAGGFVLRWFRDQLGKAELAEAQGRGVDAYELLLADAPLGPTSLLMLPHLSGSGTPLLDTASRGVLAGLTFATTSGEIAKAIIEGLCFELRANTDLLQAAGVEIAVLHAVGGGARSPLWLQCKADICNLPLRVPRVTEAACLGAALLAGTAAGVFSDLPQAVAATVRYDHDVTPQPASRARYEARYTLYRDLYPRLAELLHRI